MLPDLVREEVIVILASQFMIFFNETALEVGAENGSKIPIITKLLLNSIFSSSQCFTNIIRSHKMVGGLAILPHYIKYNVSANHVCKQTFEFIIQHVDTLPKYGKKTLDVRRST